MMPSKEHRKRQSICAGGVDSASRGDHGLQDISSKWNPQDVCSAAFLEDPFDTTRSRTQASVIWEYSLDNMRCYRERAPGEPLAGKHTAKFSKAPEHKANPGDDPMETGSL